VTAKSATEAGDAAEGISAQTILKALVPVGGRAKAGAVRIAGTPAEAREISASFLGKEVGYHRVSRVLVEEMLPAEQEVYFAIVLDEARRSVRVLASLQGGVDIDQSLAADQSRVNERCLASGEDHLESIAALWQSLGFDGQLLEQLVGQTGRVARLFHDTDATLIEINPLGLWHAPAKVVSLSAVVVIDDRALGRHPELEELGLETDGLWRPRTSLESEAVAASMEESHRGSMTFIELGGDVGVVCGGGGASLICCDAVVAAGGQLACYSEIGGNPPQTKVATLTGLVLRCPNVQGLLVAHNFTNNTSTATIAAGVVEAIAREGVDLQRFPVVAREIGLEDDLAKEIFEQHGIEYLDESSSLEYAARYLLSKVEEAGHGQNR
jgi:succinyl-CoA synthetase beta subunit/citryl-CoA synthetase large subunit